MKSFDTNPDYEAYYKRHRSRAWVTPVIIGVSTIMTFVFLVFAFIQKSEADKLRATAEEWRILADKQRMDAAEHAEVMTQQIKNLEEQLKACSVK